MTRVWQTIDSSPTPQNLFNRPLSHKRSGRPRPLYPLPTSRRTLSCRLRIRAALRHAGDVHCITHAEQWVSVSVVFFTIIIIITMATIIKEGPFGCHRHSLSRMDGQSRIQRDPFRRGDTTSLFAFIAGKEKNSLPRILQMQRPIDAIIIQNILFVTGGK